MPAIQNEPQVAAEEEQEGLYHGWPWEGSAGDFAGFVEHGGYEGEIGRA